MIAVFTDEQARVLRSTIIATEIEAGKLAKAAEKIGDHRHAAHLEDEREQLRAMLRRLDRDTWQIDVRRALAEIRDRLSDEAQTAAAGSNREWFLHGTLSGLVRTAIEALDK